MGRGRNYHLKNNVTESLQGIVKLHARPKLTGDAWIRLDHLKVRKPILWSRLNHGFLSFWSANTPRSQSQQQQQQKKKKKKGWANGVPTNAWHFLKIYKVPT